MAAAADYWDACAKAWASPGTEQGGGTDAPQQPDGGGEPEHITSPQVDSITEQIVSAHTEARRVWQSIVSHYGQYVAPPQRTFKNCGRCLLRLLRRDADGAAAGASGATGTADAVASVTAGAGGISGTAGDADAA